MVEGVAERMVNEIITSKQSIEPLGSFYCEIVRIGVKERVNRLLKVFLRTLETRKLRNE